MMQANFMLVNVLLVAAQRSATVHEVRPSTLCSALPDLNLPCLTSITGAAIDARPRARHLAKRTHLQQQVGRPRLAKLPGRLGHTVSAQLEPLQPESSPLVRPSTIVNVARPGPMCAVLDDTRYTGYDEDGRYCEAASPALDDKAHLLIHSGRLGVVVDAGGLKAPANSHTTRNLLPRLGATSGTEATPQAVYDALDTTSTSITLDTACESNSFSYTLGVAGGGDFVQVGLVRQGHTVTQVTLTNLQFESMAGTVYGPCASFVPEVQPRRRRLAHAERGWCKNDFGGFSHPCLTSDYPKCVGFVEGQRWGKCWSACTTEGHPTVWAELSVWGDSIAFELAWDADFYLAAGCSGAITVALTSAVGTHSSTAALTSGTGGGRLSLVLTADGSSLAAAQASTHPVEVTSEAGQVLTRAATHDVFIEVPTNTPKCGAHHMRPNPNPNPNRNHNPNPNQNPNPNPN